MLPSCGQMKHRLLEDEEREAQLFRVYALAFQLRDASALFNSLAYAAPRAVGHC
jgi:hypothetical protein